MKPERALVEALDTLDCPSMEHLVCELCAQQVLEKLAAQHGLVLVPRAVSTEAEYHRRTRKRRR